MQDVPADFNFLESRVDSVDDADPDVREPQEELDRRIEPNNELYDGDKDNDKEDGTAQAQVDA